MMDNGCHNDTAEAEAVKAVFRSSDANGDGVIGIDELEVAFRSLSGWTDSELGALFSKVDTNKNGVLEYSEFIDWVFQSPSTASRPSRSAYFLRHGLDPVLEEMTNGLESAQPDDPYQWMIRFLVDQQHKRSKVGSSAATAEGQHRLAGVETSASSIAPASGAAPIGRRKVNTSACLRRACKPVLDLILSEPGWEQIEDATDTSSDIYFVWDGKSLLSRLSHPGGKEKVPRLPPEAWISRLPGMGCVCDKVNMALALRLLQKLWPEKFSFWPKSWLLPAEIDKLRRYLDTKRGETVIVKPEGGSQGDGIFLVQTNGDLDAKLSVKPRWGAGFGALAQTYVPKPLLLDGLKFDLRLYAVLTSIDPLRAYLCREGLARFCTAKYEAPTQANSNQHYMHLTNYSVNKKSAAFVKADDPFDVHTQASKRPLTTLLRQIAAQEAAEGRTFNEESLYAAFEEVVVVVLQALAPVLSVTYDRVVAESKPKPKAKAKAKAKPRRRARVDESDSDEDDEEADEDEECSDDEYVPNCFQMIGVDVLLDEKLQPWLLELNARPSMEISNPVRIAEAPEGMRRCACRDMDGEEHVHLPSEVDIAVKRLVLTGAFDLAVGGDGGGAPPPGYMAMDFDRHSPSEAQETLQAISRIYQAAGGQKKAFTTSGLRRALAGAVAAGMSPHELDTVVTRWKFQGYRQEGNVEDDGAEIGVLDFAGLLQELAMLQPGASADEPLEALAQLIESCDTE